VVRVDRAGAHQLGAAHRTRRGDARALQRGCHAGAVLDDDRDPAAHGHQPRLVRHGTRVNGAEDPIDPLEATRTAPHPDEVFHGTPEDDGAASPVREVTSPAAIARFQERPDIVRSEGRYALLNTTITPHEAMVTDLLFIRDALDAAGVGYLLVRGNDARPVIAVSWADRKALRKALVAACQDEPFYSLTVDTRKDK